MDGRAFLDPAKDSVGGPTEAYWRGAAVHAYYALLLECREVLARWGRPLPPRENVHSFVRLRLSYASDGELHAIGDGLDHLVQLRNIASYRLNAPKQFSSGAAARQAVQMATDALALLDAIEADPARRAAAIASLPPPPP